MPSLYVHVPFCIRKCAYCAFYSVPLHEKNSKVQAYLQGLKKEIELRREEAPEGVSSLFVGGGTPTSLKDEELQIFFGHLKRGFNIPETVEQTIEGNPGTLTREKLRIIREAGINRISLGVQAMDDALLRKIGRIHTVQDVREGIRLVRGAGFKNLNLDLMFGLPGQSLSDWQESLKEAVKLEPEHLSIYGLMVEEETPLAHNQRLLDVLPNDDLQAEMYNWTRSYLSDEGFLHYETSNFARPGFECQHNLGYWLGQDYLGIGPGAVSFSHRIRSKNREDIEQYVRYLKENKLPVKPEEVERLSEHERMAERIILGLRLSQGVHLNSFRQEFNQDIRDIFPGVLERYIRLNVLSLNEDTLKLNPDYWFVANSVLQEFV
ncbi:radical SAM family heme chaperone HemW [Desulfitobacterium sp. AusDCA]|uniref:radical SAM family heme chaperone HemW n=1 Tax=Desulfitobacterium sp. AusDCA TaxID=3240383 RepID=UPI003DA71C5C